MVSKCHPIAKDENACATYYNLEAHREPGSLGTTPSKENKGQVTLHIHDLFC